MVEICKKDKLLATLTGYQPLDNFLTSCSNLRVRRESLPDGIAGMVGELWGKVIIILDSSLPDHEARYIVAHEIYHHLDKHPDIVSSKKAFWGD